MSALPHGITHVNLRPNHPVRDLAASVAIYRDVLGLTQTVDVPEFGLAVLAGGAAEVALVLHSDPPQHTCYFNVTGVDALHAHCTAAGASPTPLTTHPWRMCDFVLHDPDGHMIAVGERVAPMPGGH